jgi:Zn-dependent protease
MKVKRGIKLMTVRGIEVRLDWTLFLIIGFLTFSLAFSYFPVVMPGWGAGAILFAAFISAVGLFGSVLLHELAHSVVAQRFGMKVDTIVLNLFGGVASLKEEPRHPRHEFWITIVGPLTSLLLGALAFGAAWLSGDANPAITGVLGYLAFANFILGVFNLVPAFPLDGGRILRAMIWWRTGNLLKATKIAAGAGRIFGWLFIFLGGLMLFSGFFSGIWLGLIGWFLLSASRLSYVQMLMEQTMTGAKVGMMTWQSWRVIDPNLPLSAVMTQPFGFEPGRVVPVMEGGYLVGVFNPAETAKKFPFGQTDWNTLRVRDTMTWRGSLTVFHPEADLRPSIEKLVEGQRAFAAVIGDGGQFIGIMYLSDVPRFLQMREQMATFQPQQTPKPNYETK